jgi:hypothetical protein
MGVERRGPHGALSWPCLGGRSPDERCYCCGPVAGAMSNGPGARRHLPPRLSQERGRHIIETAQARAKCPGHFQAEALATAPPAAPIALVVADHHWAAAAKRRQLHSHLKVKIFEESGEIPNTAPGSPRRSGHRSRAPAPGSNAAPTGHCGSARRCPRPSARRGRPVPRRPPGRRLGKVSFAGGQHRRLP